MNQTRGFETATLWATMVDPEVVRHLHALHQLGWGSKRQGDSFRLRQKKRAGLLGSSNAGH